MTPVLSVLSFLADINSSPEDCESPSFCSSELILPRAALPVPSVEAKLSALAASFA